MPRVKNLKYRHINQSELARRLGVSHSYVCQLLSGKRKNLAALERINAALREMFGRTA